MRNFASLAAARLVDVDNEGAQPTYDRTLLRSGEFYHSVKEKGGFNDADTVPVDGFADPIKQAKK